MAIGGAFPNTQIRIDTRRAHTGSARQDGLLLNLDAQRQPVSCRPPATRMAPSSSLGNPFPPPPPPQAHWDTNPPADLVSEEALEPVQTHRVAEFAQAAASEQIILRIGTPSDSESKAGQRPLSAPRPLARRALHGRHDLRCHSLDLFCLNLTRGLG